MGKAYVPFLPELVPFLLGVVEESEVTILGGTEGPEEDDEEEEDEEVCYHLGYLLSYA